jgi:hypothetical protein
MFEYSKHYQIFEHWKTNSNIGKKRRNVLFLSLLSNFN